MAKYQSVNGAWPTPASQLPKLTAPEAETAAKKLWRVAVGKPLGKTIKITSGIRRNRMWFSALVLNPDHGWHSLVHSLSHYYAHWKLYPGAKPHDDKGRHAFIERTMIEHVVNSGWLEGTLRRPEKIAVPADKQAERHARIVARIAGWERKKKRAETALRKLARQRSYYERAMG